jgi:hypothetical protein
MKAGGIILSKKNEESRPKPNFKKSERRETEKKQDTVAEKWAGFEFDIESFLMG